MILYILQGKCVHCSYIVIDIACVHCIVTLYACIATLCMLYNFSEISDTVLTLHSDTVYSEHNVTIQCGTLSVLYVLLKALPPVCMVYTARGESQVANIAECYICHETLTKSCIYHTNEAAVL